jgi:uncharacterized protein (TIGR03435 family)
MKTKVLVGALVLALIAAAVVLKLAFFPSIKDAYFATDTRSLQQVPAGLVVVRPTHFTYLRRNGIFYASSPHDGGKGSRMMGRNVGLRDVMAAAYGQNPSRVVLPPAAPKGNFDFLVTVAGDQRPRLQAVIRRKLDYVAQMETRDTDVLALKIVSANLPGLTVSGASEKEKITFNDVKLRFTHMRLTVMADVLEQLLKTPVVDKTGLTNYYDYTVAWDSQTQRQLENDMTARATVNKILNGLGLGLEPDTASLEMLVVKKAN